MKSILADILSEVYGIGVLYASQETVLWAAHRIENDDEAKKELKKVNQIRKKHGICPVYVPYGHRLF